MVDTWFTVICCLFAAAKTIDRCCRNVRETYDVVERKNVNPLLKNVCNVALLLTRSTYFYLVRKVCGGYSKSLITSYRLCDEPNQFWTQSVTGDDSVGGSKIRWCCDCWWLLGQQFITNICLWNKNTHTQYSKNTLWTVLCRHHYFAIFAMFVEYTLPGWKIG